MSQSVKESYLFKYVIEHRRAVKRYSLVFVITFILGLVISSGFMKFLEDRSPLNLNFIQSSPSEFIILILKIAFIFAFIISFPIITYYIVKPTFKKYEDKKNFILALTGGFTLFLIGGLFACWITIPVILFFLIGLNFDLANININITSYISFCILTALFSGLIFMIPVIRYVLIKMKLLDVKILSRYWKQVAIASVLLPLIIISNEIFEIIFYSATFLTFYGLIIFIAKIY